MNSLFASIFSEGTIVCEAEVRVVDDQLMPEELDCVRNAGSSRRAQFGTGRLCARQALGRLGLADAPLTMAPGGLPRWPHGVVGSITHTASYCAVVVMPSPPWRSVGLDAEELRRLEPGVVELITTDGERQWLADLPPGAHDDNALLLFSAKEAYFKLQYPLTGRFLDFPEVQIHADPLAGTFQAIARVEMPSSLANVSGRFAMAEGKVLCGMQLL